MITKKPQKPQQRADYKNPLEALGNLSSSAAKSLSQDLAKEGMSDLWKQILGGQEKSNSKKTSGDLKEGQELNLSQMNNKKPGESLAKTDAAPAINYHQDILHGSEKISNKESQEIHIQIQQIVIELKNLAASSKQLEAEFKDVVVEQRITKAGKYHQSFFEWMLIMIRNASMRVEDAGAWLSAVKGKKGKKQGYWDLFKKQGTTFGLSNERVVATQTG